MVVERSTRSCLLCGRRFDGRTFLCRECSDAYRNRDVPFEVRQRFYEELDLAYPTRSNTFGAYNRPAALLSMLVRLPRNVSILEVGAGGGFLLQELRNEGFTDLTASDITESAIDQIQLRVPEADLILADASSLPFGPGTFDVVIGSDVIEHLPEVDQHIACVARILKPGGLYFIKTPNRRVAELYYRARGLHDSYFWHPSMFSPGELRDALDRHDLEMRLLRPPRLTEAQIVKMPGGKLLRPVLERLPLEFFPPAVLPHIEAVARKSS